MKLFGLPIIGIVAAAIGLFLLGWVWYGMMFDEIWMTGAGLTEADYEGNSPWWMAGGLLISLAMAKGVAFVLKMADWPDMMGALKIGAKLGIVFGGAFSSYDYVWMPAHNFTLFLVNWGHLVVGLTFVAAVLTLLKKV